MSRSLSILAFSLIAVLMSNCAGTIALHDFSYHGTDAILANNSFYYVQQGVVGKASTEYDLRGGSGGFVRDGLVADAKNDLAEQSPLGPNQTYANMAIDVITENIGYWWGGTHFVKRIRLSAVVSADIVEFGEPALRSQVESPSQGQLPVLPNSQSGVRVAAPAAVSDTELKAEVPKVQTEDVANPLGIDEFVWIEFNGKVIYGYVSDINADKTQLRVRFNWNSNEKSKWFWKGKVYKTKEEAEAN